MAAAYGMHRSWVYRLLARYRAEGETAFRPRSKAPRTITNATSPATVELVVQLRDRLQAQGLDAGPHTICWHLTQHHGITISPSTVWRHLRKAGRITPQPHKRPRSSYKRFTAELPNQMWQTDFTHVRLACGRDVEVLSIIDDHYRYALSATAHRAVTGGAVVASFEAAVKTHQAPASVLSDNGMVFTTRFAGGRGGRNKFEARLQHLGVAQKHSRPNHPTTCGKVERFQQTLKTGSTTSPHRPPSPNCRPCSSGSPPTTTPPDPTGHWPGAPRPRPTRPDPKPPPPATTTHTTASATTPSTPAE